MGSTPTALQNKARSEVTARQKGATNLKQILVDSLVVLQE